MMYAYLAGLLLSLAGLAAIDARYRLVFWRRPRAAAVTLAIGVGGFLVWDLAGIMLGIFFPGSSPYDTGWLVAPGLPLEELGFLSLLCYVTLILWEYRR